MRTRPYSLRWTTLLGACALLFSRAALSDTDDFGSMSLAELMNEPVTSVSKKETKLSQSAAAITVITQDDLRRLGVTSIPDALRTVPGMDVARISSDEWAVSARGFNSQFADKLLVLIDGRTVYTPSSAGVYWNAQDLMLEDIDRIEVIRGPGATLWGSNAVNGVINITTKRSQDTQGALISGLEDSEPSTQYAARYGGKVGDTMSFRIYGKYLDQAGLIDSTQTTYTGGWHTARSGFRIDLKSSSQDSITVQGDVYDGRAFGEISAVTLSPPTTMPKVTGEDNSGENLLGRWIHSFTPDSVLTVQDYIDHAIQGDGNSIEHRTTYDIDIDHRFNWSNHDIVWGTGFRASQVDDVSQGFVLSWTPDSRHINLFNFFAQDDIALVPDRLRVTLGAKYEESNLVRNSFEPNVRMLWTPTDHQAIWAAISRATRTPSLYELGGRANAAAFQPAPDAPPVLISALPNPALKSEEVLAYEIGYRYTPAKQIAIDLSTYVNHYTHIIGYSPLMASFENSPSPPHVLMSVMQENGDDAQTCGAEATLRWQPTAALQVTASYDWSHSSARSNSPIGEGTSSQQAQLRAYLDLPNKWELNTALYYVGVVTYASGLEDLQIPAYVRADIGLLWRPRAELSLGIWGRNLLQHQHVEFSSFDSVPLSEVPRSVLGKITWSF